MNLRIVAGTEMEATGAAYRLGLRPDQWNFVWGAKPLLGLRGPNVLLYGRYRDRPDWPELSLSLRGAEARLLAFVGTDWL